MPRGRPKGSKNKLKLPQELETAVVKIYGNEKEIKKEIRRLRKVKLQCRAGSKERIELHRQIKELKEKLAEQTAVDKDKDPIIKEILKHDALIGKLGMDLRKFTVAELQKHLDKIRGEK